jgi:L-ascorbate metabolism protein UlaG (beta-lactamase superfamily)
MVDGNPATPGTLTFVGNATVLLRIGGFTLLTDPNFLHRGQRAYLGKGLWSRRLRDPALGIAELPPLDAIVLSHLHGDHFDRIARRDLDRSTPIVTTPHARRRLVRYGFEAHGLDTWQRYELERPGERLTVESLPGAHAFGAMGKLLPPVMGSLLEYRTGGEVRLRLVLSGDTLTGDHVDSIRARHPDVDVAVVHLGGTRVLLHTVTMDGAQGTDYVRRLRPASVVPVHFDDYRVMKSPLSDFLAATHAAGLGELVRQVGRGETVALPIGPVVPHVPPG